MVTGGGRGGGGGSSDPIFLPNVECIHIPLSPTFSSPPSSFLLYQLLRRIGFIESREGGNSSSSGGGGGSSSSGDVLIHLEEATAAHIEIMRITVRILTEYNSSSGGGSSSTSTTRTSSGGGGSAVSQGSSATTSEPMSNPWASRGGNSTNDMNYHQFQDYHHEGGGEEEEEDHRRWRCFDCGREGLYADREIARPEFFFRAAHPRVAIMCATCSRRGEEGGEGGYYYYPYVICGDCFNRSLYSHDASHVLVPIPGRGGPTMGVWKKSPPVPSNRRPGRGPWGSR